MAFDPDRRSFVARIGVLVSVSGAALAAQSGAGVSTPQSPAEVSPDVWVEGADEAGPEGAGQVVIAAVVDMKQRNPSWGWARIAQQINLAFGIPIDKDVVRRIVAAWYQPKPDSAGPSWLTALSHAKDSLWGVDLFRCESAVLHRTGFSS